MKKNKMKIFFLKFEIFFENHPPTRHITYKKIVFVPCNTSIMANKLRSTNLERFIWRINWRINMTLTVPNWSKWPKWQSLNPHNFTKNDHRWNIFSNLSSGQQYFLNDIKRFRQKWLVKKSKFVWRKKKPTPSTNIPLLSYRKSEQKNWSVRMLQKE